MRYFCLWNIHSFENIVAIRRAWDDVWEGFTNTYKSECGNSWMLNVLGNSLEKNSTSLLHLFKYEYTWNRIWNSNEANWTANREQKKKCMGLFSKMKLPELEKFYRRRLQKIYYMLLPRWQFYDKREFRYFFFFLVKSPSNYVTDRHNFRVHFLNKICQTCTITISMKKLSNVFCNSRY